MQKTSQHAVQDKGSLTPRLEQTELPPVTGTLQQFSEGQDDPEQAEELERQQVA